MHETEEDEPLTGLPSSVESQDEVATSSGLPTPAELPTVMPTVSGMPGSGYGPVRGVVADVEETPLTRALRMSAERLDIGARHPVPGPYMDNRGD